MEGNKFKNSIKNKNLLFERVERKTLYYEYIMAITNTILAFSVFVGLLISIFRFIEGSTFGIRHEFLIIIPFILTLGAVLYFTDRKLRK